MSMFSSTDMNPTKNKNKDKNQEGRDINPHFILECSKKLGSMVSRWVLTYLWMGFIGGTTHALTFDPNFQRDIQANLPTSKKNNISQKSQPAPKLQVE